MATQAGHSTRWGLFPNPAYVPLFESHAHHIQWVEAQLAAGTMQNVRHLWVSVRPNGVRRPYELNRLGCEFAILSQTDCLVGYLRLARGSFVAAN